MNEELIFKLIKSRVKKNQITYNDFDEIFYMLSKKEQYEVCNILNKNGIVLVDGLDYMEDKHSDLVCGTKLFQDSNLYENVYDSNKSNYQAITQTNEFLCELIQQGDIWAKEIFCIKNKSLVAKYAYHYKGFFGSMMSFDDLMQEGYIGLLKAAEKFNISFEYTFSTYAVWWIRQYILRAIIEYGFMVRIPAYMIERIVKVVKLEKMYENQELEYKERIISISTELCLKNEDVEKCLSYILFYLNYSSLNITIGEEGIMELSDFIEDKTILKPEEETRNHLLKDELNLALSTLTSREQKVLRLRFGLDDGYNHTLEEIGMQFNVTRERIRQIEAKALMKLKHPSRSKRLVDFMEE